MVDENGETVYHGIVNKEARLDIIMGLPASGKSSSLVDPISSEFKSRLIDNDKAKEKFPEYNKGWGADVVHDESKAICNKHFRKCILRRENIVLPKVGSDATKLLQDYIQIAKAEGYKVYVHFADLDRNKALGRMLRRFCEKGRFLNPKLVDKYAPVKNGKIHNCILDAYEVLKTSGMVDGFTKWDNDVAYGEKPILLENIGCEGKFIDSARTEKEVQEYGGYEPRGHEQSGHEILGDNRSGGDSRGEEFHSGSIHNKALGAIPQSSERDTTSVAQSSLGQLSAAGNHGDEYRGSAGVGQKLDMIGAALCGVGMIVGSGIDYFLLPDSGTELDRLLLSSDICWRVLCAGIIAPVVEEIIFREYLVGIISPYSEKTAVIASGFLFALSHGNFTQFFYTLLLGLFWGYIYLRTRNVVYTIILHMIFNLSTSIFTITIYQVSKELYFVWCIILIVLGMIGGFIVMKHRKRVYFSPMLDKSVLRYFLAAKALYCI